MERQKSPLDNNENQRCRNSAEKSSDASLSERLQKSRSSHLIGSGINPRDGLGQQISTEEVSPSRVGRNSEIQHDIQNFLENDTNRDPSQNEKELAKREIREKQAITTTSDGASDLSSTQDRNEKRQFSALEEEQFRKWSKSIPLDENGHRVPKTIELTSESTRGKPILVGGGGRKWKFWGKGGESSQKSKAGDQSSETGDQKSKAGDQSSETGDQKSKAGDQRSETGDQRSETGDQRSETDKWINETLGQYKLVERLGEDRFAYVYLGKKGDSKQAAVKVLKDGVPQERVERFRKEAEILKELNHPHIMRGLEFGEMNGADYLVVEDVPKETLRDIYSSHTRLSLEKIVAMVNDLADALQYLHDDKGKMHLNIKPENVSLGAYGRHLLSGFG